MTLEISIICFYFINDYINFQKKMGVTKLIIFHQNQI